MESDQIKQLAELVAAYAGLRSLALWVLVILGAMFLSGFTFWLWQRHKLKVTEAKAEASRTAAKDRRARQYQDTLKELSDTTQQLMAITREASTATVTALNELKDQIARHNVSNQAVQQVLVSTMSRLENSISSAMARVQPKMLPRDSVAYIQRVFLHEIGYAAIKSIRKALVENGYEGNEQDISNRLRTDLGDMLRIHRSALESYGGLSVSPTLFFEVEDADVERFTLCDALWRIAEGYLVDGGRDEPEEHQAKLYRRLESVETRVANTIRDYVQRLTRLHFPGTHDSREFQVMSRPAV